MFAGGMVGADAGGAAGELAPGSGWASARPPAAAPTRRRAACPPTCWSACPGRRSTARRGRGTTSPARSCSLAGRASAKVHQRVNVRCQLIDEATDSASSGGQPDPAHAPKDVMQVLSEDNLT